MIYRYWVHRFAVGVCIVFLTVLCSGQDRDTTEEDRMSFQETMARIQKMQASFTKGASNDLDKYEKFAREILANWRDRSRKHHAVLTQELCEPLSAGRFNDNRQYQVARKLALAALKAPEAIPVTAEIDLVQHVSTLRPQPKPLAQAEFAERRLKDVRVRLHAWNRLVASLDPDWDPNQLLFYHPTMPTGLRNFDSGGGSEQIQDPVLRTQYQAAIEENNRKNEAHFEQHTLRYRMKSFQASAETYIIKIYSKPPSNLKELKQLLERYEIDDTTTERILKAVAAKDEDTKP